MESPSNPNLVETQKVAATKVVLKKGGVLEPPPHYPEPSPPAICPHAQRSEVAGLSAIDV